MESNNSITQNTKPSYKLMGECFALSVTTNSHITFNSHKRLFNNPHRSWGSYSVPTWLSTPGNILLKRRVRQSKYDPIVEEAEFIEANSRYAHIRLQNGKETMLLLRDQPPTNLLILFCFLKSSFLTVIHPIGQLYRLLSSQWMLTQFFHDIDSIML